MLQGHPAKVGVDEGCDDSQFGEAQPSADKLGPVRHHQAHNFTFLKSCFVENVSHFVAVLLHLE